MYSVRTKTKSTGSSSRKWVAVLGCLIIVGGAVVAALELTNTTYWFHRPAAEVITKVGHQSDNESNPDASVTAKLPPKTPTPTPNRQIGTATDTHGQTNVSTSPTQWITSASGDITVKQPLADTTIHNGDSLVGTAKVSQVQFRLTDDQIGVIARGTLDVVNGQFSGTLNFSTHGSSGRLDVFSTTPDGAERNEIQIAVKL